MKHLSSTTAALLFRYLAASTLLLLASCTAPPLLLEQDCIVPPLPCRPAQFDKILIDTDFVIEGFYLYSIELLPRPVNTDANDHAIIFFEEKSDRLALVTNDSTISGVQHISMFTSPAYIPSEKKGDLKLTDDSLSTGIPWYSAGEKKLYFTCKSPSDDPSDYDIYRTSFPITANSFDRLPAVSRENVFDAQAAISPNGTKLYFASERDGGEGGVDLWVASRKSITDEWSAPSNLLSVNTLCNELAPSVSYDGKWLYFASNGHATVGGYDIFRARLDDDGVPHEPENIGKKVNTEYDELFPYQPSDSLLYYSSDQPAPIGKRNLYVLHRRKIDPKLATLYKGKFPGRELERLKVPSLSLDTTPIRVEGNVIVANDTGQVDAEVFWRDPKKDIELGRKSTDTAGNYAIDLPRDREYDIGAESKDKFYDVKRINTTNITDTVLRVPTLVIGDTLILRLNFPFDNYTTPYDLTIDDNGEQTAVRWQTHMDLITRSIRHDLKRLRKVLLAGHTDTVGTESYNARLSENRANFIRKELIKRGIPASLLQVDPRGESQPVTRKDGESSESFDMRSRRVEFVKIFK